MFLTSAATGRLQVGKTETAEGQWHCNTGDSSILPRVGHSCSMGAGRKRREFAFPCHLSLRQESLRSPFACLEQPRKAAAFWGPFSGRKKGPKSANPNCCGSHFWGLFCAPKMGAKLAPPYGLNVARAWSPPARFCLCCRTCYPTCSACDCLCLPAFLSVSPRRGPCLHSWPCCMCPSSVSLVAWCLRCLHSLVAMKIYSTLCPTSVCKPGRRPAFCRERHLFAWACDQNVQKGLASTNAAVSREHVTAPDPAETHASAPAAHARTLRSRNDRIARWSRRRNARRGFFKAGERLPVEARRTKAAFPVAFGAASEKGGPENGPKKRPP